MLAWRAVASKASKSVIGGKKLLRNMVMHLWNEQVMRHHMATRRGRNQNKQCGRMVVNSCQFSSFYFCMNFFQIVDIQASRDRGYLHFFHPCDQARELDNLYPGQCAQFSTRATGSCHWCLGNPARQRADVCPQRDQCQRRCQTGDLQRADGKHQPRRRGDPANTVLDLICRHGADLW